MLSRHVGGKQNSASKSPLWRERGSGGVGFLVDAFQEPTPALRATPPKRG